MAEKHIFIGLGGSGVNTLSMLKYKIYKRTQATALHTRLEQMQETYRFLFVDTDSRDIAAYNDRYKPLYEGGRVEFINDRELVNLGNMNPRAIYRDAALDPELKENRRIVEACPREIAELMEDRSLAFGAGAMRMKSRIALGRLSNEFTERLEANIRDLNAADNNAQQNVIHYWVVASCNGGTGSGTVNDVLYLVNSLHKMQVNQDNPSVGLVLFMPRIYLDLNKANSDKYQRNAFAVFNEIETIQGWAYNPERNRLYHRLAIVKDNTMINEQLPYRPFQFCIPVDINTDANNNMVNIDTMYSNVAEMLFYIHSGAGASGFKSFLNNYEEDEKGRTAENFLIPMGYIAIRKPDEEFENYIALRLKYELLRYGILGKAVDSADERHKTMLPLFDNVIKQLVLGKGNSANYIKQLKAKKENALDDDLPDNAIRDSNNKVVNILPANINSDAARAVVDNLQAYINSHTDEKRKLIKQVEHELTRWTEDNARKYGLLHVKDILEELDAYCTELYMAYTTDTNTSILTGIASTRKNLGETRDGIERELDDLYNNALRVTMREKIANGNRDDVQQYFNRLKDWVNAATDAIVTDEIFDIIHSIAVGDRGVLDRIITHVRNMIGEATKVLNGTGDDKGAWGAYKRLARLFFEKKQDITSIYVPDISEYADGYGWRDDNNLFAKWYGEIITPSTTYIPGEGYIPQRNGTKSLESIFDNIITMHEEQLVQQEYLVDGVSRLFTCSDKSDLKRVVEDLLDYAEKTAANLTQQNQIINNEWYKKGLADMLKEMNTDAFRDIQRRAHPAIFFPYSKSKNSSIIADKSFTVAPAGIAGTVFNDENGNASSAHYTSDDPSVIYKIATKLNMSLSYYDMYQKLKNTYDNCANKAFYHFHQAFAYAGGNADNIRLPREIKREAIVFTKYLLVDKLCKHFADIIRKSTKASDANSYASSPVIMDNRVAKFASASAFSVIDNEQIQLRINEASTNYYVSFTIDDDNNIMTGLLKSFTDMYSTARFEFLMADLEKYLNFLEPDRLRNQFYDALKALSDELDQKWQNAGRTEKETIAIILQILDERLNTIDKFLSNKYN